METHKLHRLQKPRKIYVNGRFLTQPITGVQRYARETLNALDKILKEDCTTRWIVLAPRGTDLKVPWNNIEFRIVGFFSGHAWEQLELPLFARDGWLVTFSGAPSIFHFAHLFAIHDAAIYDLPSGYRFLYRIYYRSLYRLSVNRAIAIFTVSEFSRGQLAKIFPGIREKTFVTYNGADHTPRFSDPQRGKFAESNSAEQPFILAVSSLALNKNFGLVLKLAEKLEGVDVRIAVAGAANPTVFGKAQFSSSKIDWLGYVDDQHLERLYRDAACFVFPSLYEGFGLPPIEAMRLGCPVVASNAASILEVCGDAALYFDPLSVDDLQRQINRVLNEPGVAEELAIKGKDQSHKYTWNSVAKSVLRAVQPGADLPRRS